MKKCTVCKEEKHLDDFYRCANSKDGKAYRCKLCDKEARRKYYLTNETSLIKRTERGRKLKYKKYGISSDDYNNLLIEQGGVCAICGNIETRSTSHELSVDHCHTTGKIRGLLCNNCNRGLGLLGDNKIALMKAYKYLKERD